MKKKEKQREEKAKRVAEKEAKELKKAKGALACLVEECLELPWGLLHCCMCIDRLASDTKSKPATFRQALACAQHRHLWQVELLQGSWEHSDRVTGTGHQSCYVTFVERVKSSVLGCKFRNSTDHACSDSTHFFDL